MKSSFHLVNLLEQRYRQITRDLSFIQYLNPVLQNVIRSVNLLINVVYKINEKKERSKSDFVL